MTLHVLSALDRVPQSLVLGDKKRKNVIHSSMKALAPAQPVPSLPQRDYCRMLLPSYSFSVQGRDLFELNDQEETNPEAPTDGSVVKATHILYLSKSINTAI